METYRLKEINKKIVNLKILYQILVDNKEFYLPKWESKSCSQKYLMNVIKDDSIFKLKRQLITKPSILKQRKTKEELMEIIETILKQKKLTLGFEIDHLPDKEWILNVLYYLEPKHPVFMFEDENLERQFPKG